MKIKIGNKPSIASLLKKGVLKRWSGNPRDCVLLPLDVEPGPICVRKGALRVLVNGEAEEVTVRVHKEVDRKSLYGDEFVDAQFYDGTARISYDREKQVFNSVVEGETN